MSRTQEQGITFFPFAVDFFEDRKIKILKGRYGSVGVMVYIYVLCQIYREGYYTKVDDDFYDVLSAELNIPADTAEQVMTFLLRRSMFNEQLLKSDAILTSAGIQERWQNAVKTRAAKTPIIVDAKFWLLPKEKTRTSIIVYPKNYSSEKKEDISELEEEKNSDISQKKAHKVKYSKVNTVSDTIRDKSNSNVVVVRARKRATTTTTTKQYMLSVSDSKKILLNKSFIDLLSESFPNISLDKQFEKIELKLAALNYPCKKLEDLQKYVLAWFDKEVATQSENKPLDENTATRLNQKLSSIKAEDI